MKKINLLVIALLFGALAYANPVDVNTAQKVAGNFYASNHSAISPTLSVAYTEKDASGVPVYYVFNVNSTKGFIIVTADDAARPIIAYSDEGAFVIPTPNNNVSYWLGLYKKQVIAIRTHNIAATSGITDEWTSYIANTKRATHNAAVVIVNPLVRSVWDQPSPYNAMCPGGSVTGCVATAMAQIMKYWSYPSAGTGNTCYYDEEPNYSENYGELCANFDSSHYVWSAMPSSVGRANSEVAKLMYDCGVSVNMDYTPTGSGAEVIGYAPSAYNSYTEYFGYDATTINAAIYNSSNPASFIALLQNELNNRRPTQFQGTDPSEGGHSWVCDGYNSADTAFDMNWGWSGYDDGYYSLNLLNPDIYDFSEYIGMIYGIEPPPGALAVQKISTDAITITVYPNPSHGVFTFNIPNNSSYQVKIYNVLGQQVNTSIISSANNAINLSAQAKGVYIYKLITENGSPVSTGRLVIE